MRGREEERLYSGFGNKIKIREPVFTLHVSAETKEVCGWYLNIFRYFNLVNATATNLFKKTKRQVFADKVVNNSLIKQDVGNLDGVSFYIDWGIQFIYSWSPIAIRHIVVVDIQVSVLPTD